MKQYTLLTNSGINKLLKTASDGSKIALKEIVVSDYDGELSEQTASIPNEKYRGAINAVTIDENDNNILDVDAIIPPEVGGFYIKTAGIYCDDGSLFAVARLADTYKPLLNEGSSKDITLNFKLQIANANESIILKVDNNVVLATRKWSDATFLKKTDKIDAYTKQESDDKFALKTELTDGLPIGAYLSYPSQKTIPAGFLIADGRSLKKAEYTELFGVIGYTYGGSGELFNIPKFDDGRFFRSTGGNAAPLGQLQLGSKIVRAGHYIGNTAEDFDETAEENVTINTCAASAGPILSNKVRIRPTNSSVVIIIKAKNVNTPTAGQIDKTILATEVKAGIAKLKNVITAKQEDAAVTEKAVSDLFSQIDFRCAARVIFNGQDVSIIDSKNISSIVKNGTGDYTIKFLKPMEDTNYYIFTSLEPFNTASPNHVAHPQYQGIKRDSLRIITGYGVTSFSDEPRIQIMIFIKSK